MPLKSLWPTEALQGPAIPGNFFSADPEYGYSYNGIRQDRPQDQRYTHHLVSMVLLGRGIGHTGSNLKYYYQVGPLHVQNYAFVYNSVFSTKFSNQLLLGVNAFNQVFHDFNNGFDAKSFGLYLSPSTVVQKGPRTLS